MKFTSFFRINPKESPQYVGLVQLLLHFQWNWFGLLASEDDRGECFISTLTAMLQEKAICPAFTLKLKLDNSEILWKNTIVTGILIGALHFFEKFKKVSFGKVCIFTSHWKIGGEVSEDILQYIKLFHGVLHFRDHSRDVSEFSHFLMSLDPLNPQGNVLLSAWRPLPGVAGTDAMQERGGEFQRASRFAATSVVLVHKTGIMWMVVAEEILRQTLLISDAIHCEPCPKDQFPNKDKDQCIAKKIHFLGYQDTLGYILVFLALFLSVITSA
ncbi:hypothetical protein E2320_022067, partial [Naja naja]